MKQFVPISPEVSPKRLKTTDTRIRRCLEKKKAPMKAWPIDERKKIAEEIKNLSDRYFRGADIDYSSKYTQIAYAIAYYPNYVEGLTQILELINLQETRLQNVTDLSHSLYNAWASYFHQQKRQRLNIVFLGSGPAPELYSFKRFLDFLCYEAKLPDEEYRPQVSVDLFEIEQAWEWSLENITKSLMNHERQTSYRKMNINFQQHDLTKPINSIAMQLKQEYHLIFLQNFANEIPRSDQDTSSLINNLKLFIGRLKPGIGYCVIAGRGLQNFLVDDLIRDYVEQEQSLEFVIKGKRIDLNANHKEEEDAELKDYIYSEVPWKYDYRRFDNKPIVFVIKSVVK
tara:strand:+ start:791 stop:1816 length:1026 start_codon:yes stop_codon:yes gene_type:complete